MRCAFASRSPGKSCFRTATARRSALRPASIRAAPSRSADEVRLSMAKPPRKKTPARAARAHTATPGASPGLVHSPPGALAPDVRVVSYDADSIAEERLESLSGIAALRSRRKVVWVDVDGLGDAELIAGLGKTFGLHALTMEDVTHVHQRAKVEFFPTYVFVVVRMIHSHEPLEMEQLSIVFGKDFVLTFQEGKPGDCLDPVRERLRQGRGRMRHSGPDYLAYALIDAVVDHYFPVMNRFADRLDGLEDEVLGEPYLDVVWAIHSVKRDLLTLHRAVLPHRDLLQALVRDPTPLVGEDARLHLRDVSDHAGQIIDLLACYREMAQALIEIHLNVASNRMNEVMQVLTIIGSIFIPLTFVVGVYGMNFDAESSPYNMPELKMRYGYPITMALMALGTVGMLLYFRRRGWLKRPHNYRKPGPPA
ncbi:MAG: magnesium/cobalt transporter CorA [Myxococcales bacterium]|nr:magnesium/cobalt transporter CorA [Myxococcales bacterium]